MSLPNVDEFLEDRKNGQQAESKAQRKQLVMLAQAVVEAENMTGVPEWDRFLSYVSAASEACGERAAALRDRIADPSVVGHDEIMQLKISLEGWIQRGLAFDAVIRLPKDLMEVGEDARELLERMGD